MLAERAATWPDQWMAEGPDRGRKKGRQEGRSSGLLEGQRIALMTLAETKFGILKPRHADSIAKASAEQLQLWLKDILTATKPDDFLQA